MRLISWTYLLSLTASPSPSDTTIMTDVPPVTPTTLFGLFYTSGSTGKPKGVMSPHRTVHNLVHWWARLVDLNPADKVLQFSPYSFIMSLRQIWPTLCVGGTLVLPTSKLEFGAAIAKCGVTKMALTPSGLATIDPATTPSLKIVQVAGEASPLPLAKTWARRLDAFFIGLGPTELTAHACTGRFDADTNTVTIGFPVTNAAAYIVNAEGQLQPPGVIGELWIAGESVALGYLNKPELSNQVFIQNPFDFKNKPNLYRTGDFARRLADGPGSSPGPG